MLATPGSKPSELDARLPHPQPLPDPQHDPFVGNETVDENICEWVQLATWNALPDRTLNISVNVTNGTVTLTGSVHSPEQRQAVAAAVAKVQGVAQLIDKIRVARPRVRRSKSARHPASIALEHVVARPMFYVVRHCVLDEASMSAAMHQAVPLLDDALSACDLPPMQELIVIYRNRIPGAVTVEIGVPVDPAAAPAAGGEPALGQSPGGAMLIRVAEPGLAGLLRQETALVETARAAGLKADAFFWQSFSREQAHSWNGHPEARILLPIVRADPLAAPLEAVQ